MNPCYRRNECAALRVIKLKEPIIEGSLLIQKPKQISRLCSSLSVITAKLCIMCMLWESICVFPLLSRILCTLRKHHRLNQTRLHLFTSSIGSFNHCPLPRLVFMHSARMSLPQPPSGKIRTCMQLPWRGRKLARDRFTDCFC